MHLTKYFLIAICALFTTVMCGKLKFVAFKGPHGGFVGLKARKPKLLGHGFGGFGGGHKFGGGGFHSSGYEHHESHHSYHSSAGGAFGGKFGWLGK